LALSPLIKLLVQGSPKAQVCAANALATAERKRSIEPLLHLAQRGDSVDVKEAAVRALGLIRHGEVVTALRAIIDAPDAPASLIASGLIALSRVADADLPLRLQRLFSCGDVAVSQQATLRSVAVLAALFKNVDGVVISRKPLYAYLECLLKTVDVQQLVKSNEQRALAIALVDAIAASQQPAFNQRLFAFFTAKDPDVRMMAYKGWLLYSNSPSLALIKSSLFAESSAMQFDVAAQVVSAGSNLPVWFWRELLGREQTAASLSEWIAHCPVGSRPVLSQQGSLASHQNKQVRSAYWQCRLGQALGISPQLASVTTAALLDTPILLEEIVELTAKQPIKNAHYAIIKVAVNHASVNDVNKQQILLGLAKAGDLFARRQLLKQVQQLEPDLLSVMFGVVEANDLDEPMQTWLWDVVKNEAQPQLIRLRAGRLLATTEPEKVMMLLQSERNTKLNSEF